MKSQKSKQIASSKQVLLALKEARARLEEIEHSKSEPIAIIGIGCRFPGGANNPETFWQLLREGKDAIKPIPSERWDIDAHYNPNPDTKGKMYIREAGLLSQVDQFSPQFFGISPKEAISLDPQQRLMLEVSWEALERAGQSSHKLKDSQTGVFLGIDQNDYAQLQFNSPNIERINPYDATGNGFCFASGRLSYFLGLQGPCLAIDTACSSSLVALHLACQSLRSGECNLALAGGVQLILSPVVTTTLCQMKALSPDGRCKTFDASADGYGRGEGCGAIVLKRLSDAMRDGDNILATIRGSAVNHDGPSSGLTVPNKLAQEKLIHQALETAKVDPSEVSYIEAHGTGTSLGDPIEIRALAKVFQQSHSSENPLMIGSVKTNIGHLEAAAGIAGLIKVVLQMQHQEIAPHLHFTKPNSYINWEELPVVIPTQKTQWSSDSKGRLAGVSSFGMSGTNAHVIVEEAPIEVKNQKSKVKIQEFGERPQHILTLSAKCENALQELVQRYEEFLSNDSTATITDTCFTANTGRSHFNHRLAIVASSTEELRQKLKTFKTQEDIRGVVSGQLSSKKRPKIAFLFTGQGSQYVNMARELYETQPIFRKTLEQCDRISSLYSDKSLLNILYPQPGETSPIDETVYTQPALFAIEYALAQLWKSWGIEPDVVMGHSVGEYVAATVAGVFSLEDGLKLIANRGRLMQELPPGGEMLAVMASESQVREVIEPYKSEVAIAAINGPISTVISGAADAIRRICEKFSSDGIKTKQLQVSHAFHSSLMEPMLAEFERVASEITYNQPSIAVISNLTGEQAKEDITTPKYWVNHVRQPVRFRQGMETLEQQGYEVFLEIGSKPILLGMGRQCLSENVGVWLPSLRPGYSEWQQMLQSLAELYVRGVKVDWSGFDGDYYRSKVVLPTYPFQRQRYWIETDNNLLYKKQFLSNQENLHPLLGQRLNLAGPGEQIYFESQISASQPNYLKDHCVFSKPIFPTTAYLEMAIAAGSTLFNCENLILEDVVVQQALIVPDSGIKTIQTVLTPQSAQTYSFQIFSLEVDSNSSKTRWTLHVEGKLLIGDKDAQPETTDLKTIKAEYNQQISPQDFYQEYKELGIGYGSSFQAVQQLWHHQEKALGKIQLPDNLVSAIAKYQLHPVLLDASFQVLDVFSGVTDDQETYLPVAIKRLKVYRHSSTSLWSQVEIDTSQQDDSQTLIGEVHVLNEDGKTIATVEGLKVQKVTTQGLFGNKQESVKDSFYEVEWRKSEQEVILAQRENIPTSNTKSEPRGWLILADQQAIAQNLALQLQSQEDVCILVKPGKEFQQISPHEFTINSNNPLEFEQLLVVLQEQLPHINGVVQCWSLDETDAHTLSDEDLLHVQQHVCGTTLSLVQALVKIKKSQSPQLWLVTSGAQPVPNNNPIIPGIVQSSLWGMGKVIALEHPELKCVRVDLDPSTGVEQQAKALWEEICSNDAEDQVAIREQERYVARLIHHQQTKKAVSENSHFESTFEKALSFNEDVTYLITGGLGSLGLLIAKWMVERGARHLVLLGRSGASDAIQTQLKELEQAGAKVVVYKADVSQAESITQVLSQIEQSLPPLRGIIHAAGVLDDGVLQNQTWEKFATVMAPKVQGAWNLHNLTLDTPLDFFVLFSSVASLLGSPGQANHSAANAFLDAFAYYRRSIGLPVLSINLGVVAEIGVAAKRQTDKRVSKKGIGAILPQQITEALEIMMSNPHISPQVGFVPIRWSQLIEQFTNNNYPYFYLDFVRQQKEQNQTKQKPTQNLEFLSQLENISIEKRQEFLVIYLQNIVKKVLQFNSSEHINPHKSLNELGLDSLNGIELRNQIEGQLGLTISAEMILKGASVIELAEEIAQQLTQNTSFSQETNSQHGITKSVDQSANNWIHYHTSIANSCLRLFCFHNAGGNASIFKQWSNFLPPDIEVCPIQLPGRAERIMEEPFTQFLPLIQTLEQVIIDYLDKPFAFYSHSAGNLLSFELAHILRQNYDLEPIHLFAGAFWAPHTVTKNMADHFFKRSDEEIINTFLEISEVPREYIHKETFVKEHLPTLIADTQFFQSYTYSKKQPLNCPISAFGGIEDPIVSYEELTQWSQHTTSNFKVHMLPGKHMFLKNSRKLLLEGIFQELMTSLNINSRLM